MVWPWNRKKRFVRQVRQFTDVEVMIIEKELSGDPLLKSAFTRYNRLRNEELEKNPPNKGWWRRFGRARS